MPKKPKTDARMWINPRSNLQQVGHVAWNRRATDMGDARYLELADVALKPKSQKGKVSAFEDATQNSKS
jgi:hypothetical protein